MLIEKLEIKSVVKKKILAFGAHPDDIEFGAGGTLAILSSNNQIKLIIATDGGLGTHDKNLTNGELSLKRINEARASAKILGIQDIGFWSYPDGSLKSWDKKLRLKIIKTLLKVRPDIVFSFDPWVQYEPGLHPDHRALAWAVAEMWHLIDTPLFLKKMRYETHEPLIPKPQLWLYAPTQANVAVEITKSWDKKIKALKQHESQFNKQKQSETEERLKLRFSEVGKDIGVTLAEPFRILK